MARSARRLSRQQKRPLRDIRQFIGFSFLAGYYLMVVKFTYIALPEGNIPLIRDAMLTLGPPVGLIVGAMFRSDAREEQATANTGEAFKAVTEMAKSTGTGGGTGDEAELPKPTNGKPKEPKP